MTRRRDTQSEFVFPHLGEPISWSRQSQGLLPLGRNGLMTQSQPLPFPEASTFP